MNSVQSDSVGHIATQEPVTNARPEASRIHLGRTIVSSQPCSCTCPSNPPPSYEEATQSGGAARSEGAARPTQINIPDALYMLNESQKLIRQNEQAEQERRAREKGCCESLCSDGCCGDMALICCYIACCLCLSFCD